MRNRMIAALAFLGMLLSASTSLFAHHGTAAFDTGRKVILKGVVTEWYWSNPHCLLQFDVKNESDGQVTHWIAETQNPVTMVNGGWSKQSLKPGDEVTVTLIPVKNGKPIGRIKQVLLPNGNTLDAEAGLGAKTPTASSDGTNK